MKSSTESQFLDWALQYASFGWPVLPIHGIGEDGGCTCLNRKCQSPGKHPLTPHGCKDGSISEEIIRAWLRRWPNCNIGVVTGRVSGVITLDCDGPEGRKNFDEQFCIE